MNACVRHASNQMILQTKPKKVLLEQSKQHISCMEGYDTPRGSAPLVAPPNSEATHVLPSIMHLAHTQQQTKK
jgi:hypothetical protein